MIRSKTRWLSSFLTGFIGVFGLFPAWADSSGDAALQRLGRTTASAVERTPALRAAFEDLSADEAAAASQSGAGTPSLEYVREGIGSSFDRQPNSQDTVSLGIPFNGPGQGSRGRRLTDAAGLRTVALKRVAVLDVVRVVGEEWVRTAALADRIEVVRTRLDHLDKALILQNKRLELGVVAGTEVMQLELARAAEASMKAGLEADADRGRHRMEALCGDGCVFPAPGDLVAIQTFLGPMTRLRGAADFEAAPEVRGVMSDKALAEAQADLTAATIWGRPSFGVEWEHIPSLDGVEGWNALGLQLSVPLPFGRSGKRQVEEAEARSRAAAAWAEAEMVEIQARYEGVLSEFRGAEARLAALNPVLSRLERTEFSLGEQFRLGAVSYLVYIDGLSRLDGVQLEAVDAREQLLQSRLRLAVLLDDAGLFPLPPSPPESVQEN
ncbi:MAG: TolC family protein [Acidobacteriota bacterium]